MLVVRKFDPVVQLPKRKRVAAYARVSSGKDAMLHSLSSQVSYFSEYIQQHRDWEYVGVYADEAISGTKEDRPEMQRMLADCQAGRIDMVIVKSVSRFARNTVMLLETVRELTRTNVDVFFEQENIHTHSADGELILTILASYSEAESFSVSENCKWRIRKRFQDGELVNLRFMFGYQITRDNIGIDSERAEIVQMIFSDYVSGMGSDLIAKKLNNMGIKGLLGGKWSAKRVTEILKNEKVTGNALLQKSFVSSHLSKKRKTNHGELPKFYLTDSHPAIIQESTFQEAQRILEENRLKNNIAKKASVRHSFAEKIICDICGKHYKRKVRKNDVKWNCATYLQFGKSACFAKQIPESTLLALSAEVLGLPEFNEDHFRRHIKEIHVPAFNKLVFYFIDDRIIERDWSDRQRNESWNAEQRHLASVRELMRREKDGTVVG